MIKSLRKRELLVIVFIILLASSALAAWFVASEKVTVSSVIKSLTAATYARATGAMIQVETASVYWSCDPVKFTADSMTGFFATPMTQIPLDSSDKIRNFRAIKTGATDATLKCQYYQ